MTSAFVVLLTGFAVWLVGKLFDVSATFAYVTARTTKRNAALIALIIWLVGGLSTFLSLARQG